MRKNAACAAQFDNTTNEIGFGTMVHHGASHEAEVVWHAQATFCSLPGVVVTILALTHPEVEYQHTETVALWCEIPSLWYLRVMTQGIPMRPPPAPLYGS